MVGQSDVTIEDVFSATIEGRQDVEIYPQLSGKISKVCIKEGPHVKEGQILFVIDQVPYKAALRMATANVHAAKARLETARLERDSKRELLEGLTAAEKTMVRSVFLTQPLPENAAGATLLLPRSFVEDGLMTQAEQNAMFTAVAAKYTAGPLFIKTHPRDTTDYHALFPDAVILERTMPSEVLNFCLPFKFARAVTVQSFVLRAFTAADEKILLTLDEAKALI